jgi:hypothetical protein
LGLGYLIAAVAAIATIMGVVQLIRTDFARVPSWIFAILSGVTGLTVLAMESFRRHARGRYFRRRSVASHSTSAPRASRGSATL